MLDLAQHYGSGPITIQGIAGRQRIPKRFLEQILLTLKRAGYLRSSRGLHGGYVLSKPPDKISVAEITRIIDGPLAPIACVSIMAKERCPLSHGCALRLLWKEVRDLAAETLEGRTFADLALRADSMQPRRREADQDPAISPSETEPR
jgi:Rrf2 family protein